LLAALVDSGAHRTLFPLGLADALGIRSELQRDPKPSQAPSATFQTWSHADRIEARIVTEGSSGPLYWGPPFTLSPAFGPDVFLLGREDFFSVFTVSFEPSTGQRLFHIDSD